MKKIKYIIILTLIFGLPSCTKDFLELQPKVNLVEANFYRTENDALLAVTAVYDALSVQNWAQVPITADIKSDDAYCGGDAGGNDMSYWQEQEKFQMLKENTAVINLWNRCYTGIYRANQFLSKVGEIQWKNDAYKNRLIGETKFLRAYFYWDLVRHYGWVPIILDIISVEDSKTLQQSDPKAVYKQIATDMLEAVDNCPATVPSTEAGRVTKYAAQCLLARIYLYYEGFAKPVFNISEDWSDNDGKVKINKAYVQAALKEVIESNAYDLMPTYAEVFDWANDHNTKESVFSWQYSEKAKSSDWTAWNVDGNFAVIFYGVRTPQGSKTIDAGWSFGVPSWNLVKAFESKDTRLKSTVYFANDSLTKYFGGFQNTGYFNYKFLPRTQFRATAGAREHNYPINYPDIRYSDVLLMAAELLLNDNAGLSQEYYDKVRKRAFGSDFVQKPVSLDNIYEERRLELSGEGHRYWDLLRRGFDYAAKIINSAYIDIPADAPNKADFEPARNFDPTTYGMFPIPASEIRNTNDNLKQFIPAYQ